MLQSPQERRVRSRVDEKSEEKAQPTYITVGGISQSNSRSDTHVLQAYVLHWPEHPRWVQVKEKRSQTAVQVAVATCVLADRDGPVLVDFWRDLATSTIDSLNLWSEANSGGESQGPAIVELKYFWIQAENRKSIVPLQKVVSSERTAVSRLAEGTQESVTCMTESPLQ